jgi:outer membrane scaffolding protein for murein synthesis (MipA/OmpV family)
MRLPAARAATALLALLPALAVAQAVPGAPIGDDAPVRWEAGFAAGGGRLTDYPGADQSHVRGLVTPILFYRGPILRVDQSGIRGRFFDTPDLELSLSATAAFDARNNDARAGMPDLDYLFGVGPQLIYKGVHAFGAPSLHLKLRALMSTDFHRIDERGVSLDPELRWHFHPLAGSPGELTFSLEPSWASRGLTKYFYEVDPSLANAARPAYRARAGYLGTEATLTWSRRLSPSLRWFVSARGLSLHGSANADSPLLRSQFNFGAGAGIVWTPWRSGAPAQGEPD